MVKRLIKSKPEPHVTIERRKYVATCPACTRGNVETTRVSFGPAFMAMRIRLCDECLRELRATLATTERTRTP